MVLTKKVPMDKSSPPIRSMYFRISTACPSGQTEYSRDHLSWGAKLVEDHLSMGIKFSGIICPWRRSWLGTDYLEGLTNWGPIEGNQMSRDHMRLGQPHKISNPPHASYAKQTMILQIFKVLNERVAKGSLQPSRLYSSQASQPICKCNFEVYRNFPRKM